MPGGQECSVESITLLHSRNSAKSLILCPYSSYKVCGFSVRLLSVPGDLVLQMMEGGEGMTDEWQSLIQKMLRKV